MNRLAYDVAAATLRLIFRTAYGARVYGRENVPLEGPLIVACNHVSYLDPPALAFCPRRISFMAKKELFDIPILGPTIRAVGAFPVDRRGSAQAAIKRSLAVLQAGGAVGIFPEGTRNLTGEIQPQTGVALLASWSQAPVLPACVVGGDKAARSRQIKVAFGVPLTPAGDRKAKRDDLAKFTEQVMSAIAALAGSIGGNS